MVDAVFGGALVLLAVRGWMRGLVREVIGLAVVVAGLVLSFRLSTPLGKVVESLTGWSADPSRLVAGVLIVVAIGVVAAVVSRVLHLGMRLMPGVTTLNRSAGAAFSTVGALLVATVVLSLVVILRAGALPAPLAESAIVGFLTDPDGTPQQIVGTLAGDRVTAAMMAIQAVVGERRIVAPSSGAVPVPPADVTTEDVSEGAADEIYDLLNRHRVAANASPLDRSAVLDDVAVADALEAARVGRVGVMGPSGDTIVNRLVAAEVRVAAANEVMVLAPAPRSAFEALAENGPAEQQMIDRNRHRVGVGAVRSPYGLLVVIVLTN